jgi:hypothetical protein
LAISVKIDIANWDKYNPRKDLKTMPWIRLESDIGFSESLFGLPSAAKWTWVFILSYSAKKKTGIFEIDFNFLAHHTGCTEKELKNFLNEFFARGLLLVDSSSSRITNESVRITNVSRTNPIESVPNITNRTEQNERNEHDRTDLEIVESSFDYTHPLDLQPDAKFNFEDIYNAYPRKDGKKRGLEILKKKIKTQQDFEKLELAVQNYRISTRETEKRFIKQFSTFANCWEDYLEIDNGLSKEDLEWLKQHEKNVQEAQSKGLVLDEWISELTE